MELTVFHDKLYNLVDPREPLEQLDTGYVFVEGPIFFNGVHYFTDFQVDKIYRYQSGVTTLVDDHSDFSIGLTYDRVKKRILRCTRNRRAITEMDGRVVVSHYKGIPINGSNDIVVDSHGRIYFSDPLSRTLEGPQIGHSSVFMYDEATGEMEMLESEMTRPNGVALTPDETGLYIIDTNTFSVYLLDLSTRKKNLFVTFDQGFGPGKLDGMCVDIQGNIYVTGPGGIWAVGPDGTPLGIIRTPEPAANLCFDDTGLFITATSSIYHVKAKIPSAI